MTTSCLWTWNVSGTHSAPNSERSRTMMEAPVPPTSRGNRPRPLPPLRAETHLRAWIPAPNLPAADRPDQRASTRAGRRVGARLCAGQRHMGEHDLLRRLGSAAQDAAGRLQWRVEPNAMEERGRRRQTPSLSRSGGYEHARIDTQGGRGAATLWGSNSILAHLVAESVPTSVSVAASPEDSRRVSASRASSDFR
jgi:hypothetical protein